MALLAAQIACGSDERALGPPIGGSSTSSSSGGFVCVPGAPAPLASDKLDPGLVYLAGTVHEDVCEQQALVHYSDPSSAVTGFDCMADLLHASIRPSDGLFLYPTKADGQVHAFHCDDCPYAGTYPKDPLANDPVMDIAPCGPATFPLTRFLLSPKGTLFRECNSAWYDAAGKMVLSSGPETLLHVGYDNVGLTAKHLVPLGGGTAVTITGLPGVIQAARAVRTGEFWVVVGTDASDYSAQELWEIATGGAATRLAIYAPPPGGTTVVYPDSSQIDEDGVLFELATGLTPFDDIIIRRDRCGHSDVVYDVSWNPLVKIHDSALVSGP